MDAVAETEIEVGAPTRLLTSMRLHRFGGLDPTMRLDDGGLLQAVHTPEGWGVLEVRALDLDPRRGATRFVVRGHGPAGAHLIERAPRILGQDDDPEAFVPQCRTTRRLVREVPGLRLCRAASPFALLVSLIFQQRVAWRDAARAHKRLVERHGSPAPGFEGLRLPPAPRDWSRIPPAELSALDVDRRRGETVRRAAKIAGHVHRMFDAPADEARRKLASVEGLGPWTVGGFLGFALGDPDAVPLGDYDLPHRVATAFRGQPRATDEEMIAILEPYRGHRFRVLRMIEESSIKLTRFAPRRGSGRPRLRR